MKARNVSAIKRAALELMENACTLKLFLPLRRGASVDAPCLSEQVIGLRQQVSEIERLLELEFPRKPGDDVLWRAEEFELPSSPTRVLVSIRGLDQAQVGYWDQERAGWFWANTHAPMCDVYAWSPMPAACYAQRERLLLQAPFTRVEGRAA